MHVLTLSYDYVCHAYILYFAGNYSFVSDATKSTAFLNASINYLLQKYPKPWNNASSLISNV